MRSSIPLRSRAPAQSSNTVDVPQTHSTPHQSSNPIPSIRLISATPSAAGSASSEASDSFNRSLEEAWASLPLAPKAQPLLPSADSARARTSSGARKLVPKKSKLSLLGLSRDASQKERGRDLSDVVRRVGASAAVDTTSGSAFEIYVDPDPLAEEGMGEMVHVVKKVKSRAKLDGMLWGAPGADVTNVPKVTNTAPVANNANLLKVKGEEGGGKEKWWSIGRGRKDSKEKTKEKENKISYQPVEYIHNPNPPRSKTPDPTKFAQSQETRARFNSLDSGILLNQPLNTGPPPSAPSFARSASLDVNAYLSMADSQPAQSVTPTGTFGRSATPTAGGLLAVPGANANKENGGSIALRAMRSVRSIARMSSWAQLKNMPAPGPEESGAPAPVKEKKEKKEKSSKKKAEKEAKEQSETGEKEKKSKKKSTKKDKATKEKSKDKPAAQRTSTSSFEIGALTASPAPPGRFATQQAPLLGGLSPADQPQAQTLGLALGAKKRSILGLGLPSSMRLPSVRSGSTASSNVNFNAGMTIGSPIPLGSTTTNAAANNNRLSVDSNPAPRPGSLLSLSSAGSSLRPLSTTSTASRASSALSRNSSASGTGSVRWDEEGLETVREQRRQERREKERESREMEADGGIRDVKTERRASRESKHSLEGRRRTRIGEVFPEVVPGTAPASQLPIHDQVDEDGDVVMRSPTRSIAPSQASSTMTVERRRRASYPILTIEEATADGHCAADDFESEEGVDELQDSMESNGGEVQATPVKKARARPLSEQLLGKSRPKPMYEDEEGVLSILDAATNDLALLINNLDLQATPSTPDLTPLRPSAFSTLEKDVSGTPTPASSPTDTISRRGKIVGESPLKKNVLTSNGSISSLRPYAQSRGYAPKASVTPTTASNIAAAARAAGSSNANSANAALVANQIVPWATLMLGLSPVKEKSVAEFSPADKAAISTPPLSSSTSTFRPGHKRTMTPAPEPEPEPVFQPLRPARSRAVFANNARLQAPSPIVTVQEKAETAKEDSQAPLSSLTLSARSRSSSRVRSPRGSVDDFSGSLTPVFKRISEYEKERERKRSSLVPPSEFGTSRGNTPHSARSRGSTFSTANLSLSPFLYDDDEQEHREPLARATRRALGMSGTMGGSDVSRYDEGEPDASDPDSDVPDELRDILQRTTGHAHSDSSRPPSVAGSYADIGNAAMLGDVTLDADQISLAAPVEAPPALPIFRASVIDDDANHYSISDDNYNSSPARSCSEDDTKKSFDFTGELQKLNESGGSDRRSFVEQLENAFRTPAKIDLRYGFGVGLAPSALPPPVPPMPASLPMKTDMPTAVPKSVEFRKAIEAQSSSSSMGSSASEDDRSFEDGFASVSQLVDVKQPSLFDKTSAAETDAMRESQSKSRFDMFDSASRIVDIKEPTLLQDSDSLGAASSEDIKDSLFSNGSSPGVARGRFQQPSPAGSERPSEGELDRSFKFGGLPSRSAQSSPASNDRPLTLSDIIPSPSHARELSLNGSFNFDDLELEDDSVMQSIHAHLIGGAAALAALPSGNSNGNKPQSAAETLAEKRRTIYKANSRPTSGISFEGFTSFDEVRRGFEFSDDRPAFYPPAVPKNAATTNNVGATRRAAHRKHESAFSIASVSSYGQVVSAGSLDPFDYGDLLPSLRERPSSEDVSSISISMEVEDTFAYRAGQPLRLRKRVDSDASSFYFSSAPLPLQQARGHRRRESVMSATSQAPPVSLYNRSFGQHGHRRNDSNTSALSNRHKHRRDFSGDSVLSDFSVMQHLGRPGLGDKMFGESDMTGDHGPLSVISASPPESASRPTFDNEETGYDSIMDGEQQRYSAEYSDSIFEKTGYDTRYRDSVSSDMVFDADFAQRYDEARLQPPIQFNRLPGSDRSSVHSPVKEDDTMISMFGGGHVRRRSMEISPCARVEKRKHSAVLMYRGQEHYESPNKARIVEKPSIASTSSFQFGGERMIKAQRGLLERQSLEDSCLIADGEELAVTYRSVPVFTKPTPATRSRSSTCTSSSGGDTPPLSASDGASISEGSQSSIDLSQINVALSNAIHPMSTVARARARARARGTGHRRRYSKSHISRSSVYETIEEEMMSSNAGSPAQSLLSKKSSPTARLDQAVYVVDSDTVSINSRPEESTWDDDRGIMALRKYYALRDEAQTTVSESRRMWSDTPFSLFAIQSFQAPAEPAGMQALLAHSVQNYGPLPSELRPHRVRSRTSSRPSPYPQTRTSKTTLSPDQTSRTGNSNVDTERTPVLRAKPVNNNVMTMAPSLEALKPFSPLSFLNTEPTKEFVPKKENAFGLAPDVRPRVGSNARRTALGWSKRSNGPGLGKSSTDQKENAVGTGISMTPGDNLRLNRPRPRGRPTPGGRTPASQNRAIRV